MNSWQKPARAADCILRAPAKVNIFLHVLGRRDDGYHELVTQMQKIDIYDGIEVWFEEQPGINIGCSDRTIPCDSSNLLYRAAAAFQGASSCWGERGITIFLDKKIPVGAGLGGGSSDAGTLLRGLNHYFDDELSDDVLQGLAVPLGADVPFFASPHSASFATGIGEKLQAVDSSQEYIFVVINPGIFISTAEIFKKFSLTRSVEKSIFPAPTQATEPSNWPKFMHNDLEDVVFKEYPKVGELKAELAACGATATLMSGSGSTVFALFPQGENVSRSCQKVFDKYGQRVYIAQAI